MCGAQVRTGHCCRRPLSRVLPEIRVPDTACQHHCLDKPRALAGGEASALMTRGDRRVRCWVFSSIPGLHSLDAMALPRE